MRIFIASFLVILLTALSACDGGRTIASRDRFCFNGADGTAYDPVPLKPGPDRKTISIKNFADIIKDNPGYSVDTEASGKVVVLKPDEKTTDKEAEPILALAEGTYRFKSAQFFYSKFLESRKNSPGVQYQRAHVIHRRSYPAEVSASENEENTTQAAEPSDSTEVKCVSNMGDNLVPALNYDVIISFTVDNAGEITSVEKATMNFSYNGESLTKSFSPSSEGPIEKPQDFYKNILFGHYLAEPAEQESFFEFRGEETTEDYKINLTVEFEYIAPEETN